jgi:hypothetical protein
MECTISAIEKVCKSNGGIQTIEFLLPEGVLSIPMSSCVSSSSDSINVIGVDYEAVNIAFVKRTASFTEKANVSSREGDYFEQEISFEVPKDRPEVNDLILKLRNRRIHVIYTDNNGVQKLVPNMRLQPDFSTRSRKSERNGYTFLLKSKSISKSIIFTGTVSTGEANNPWLDPNGDPWIDPPWEAPE